MFLVTFLYWKSLNVVRVKYDEITNIPLELAKSIIFTNYFLIQKETSVPEDLFMELLTFFDDGISYFTYSNIIYKQNKGLAMGNRLSQWLAEIVTGFMIFKVYERMTSDKITNEKITFLVKSVDDSAMDSEIIPVFETYEWYIVPGLKIWAVIVT